MKHEDAQVQPADEGRLEAPVRPRSRYTFMWRVIRNRRKEDAGWHSKTIIAADDMAAYEAMHDHGYSTGRGCNVEFDYEMARDDVPYDPKRHAECFWDMQSAGLPLTLW